MIEEYEFGRIRIDGRDYDHDVIVFKSQIKSWWRIEGHEVSPQDIEDLVEEGPKTIVFGTGAYGAMKVPAEVKEYLKARGIQAIALLTKEATQKFNELSEKEGIAGAFHLTC